MAILKESEVYRKWERKLVDERARTIIATRVNRLAYGLAGDVSPVGGGISELRIHYGPGYRIYFQRRGAAIILLLCGGDKSSQRRDIEAAKEIAALWKD
jgi:putative addiction module killer protein